MNGHSVRPTARPEPDAPPHDHHPTGLQLHDYGWTETREAEFAARGFRAAGLHPARLVRVDRLRADAVTGAGDGTVRTERLDLTPVLTDDPTLIPVTGDWVATTAESRTAALDGTAEHRLHRSTALLRSSSSTRSDGQVLAANVDTVALVIGLDEPLNAGRLERLLALAWESGAAPAVVLTKADLASDAEHMRADAEAAAPGVPVFLVAGATGDGVEELAGALAGGSSVLVGASGAGKSTLLNRLLGREAMHVSHTRNDGKGRHTTVTRELLPLPGGGVLIDTPGLRGVGMFGSEEGIGRVFAEIEALVARCRFRDCGHETEPGCEVQRALADGELPRRRYDSWRKLQRENAWIASRSDARLRSELARPWKAASKQARRRNW